MSSCIIAATWCALLPAAAALSIVKKCILRTAAVVSMAVPKSYERCMW